MGNYEECLSLFFKLQAIKEDVFIWLHEIKTHIRSLNYGNFDDARITQMKSLILKSINQFVEMDSS